MYEKRNRISNRPFDNRGGKDKKIMSNVNKLENGKKLKTIFFRKIKF